MAESADDRFDVGARFVQISGRGGNKGRPKSAEHRAKIAQALKAHHSRPDSHLRQGRPKGEEAPNWKGGIRTDIYRDRAFAAHGEVCNRCGSTEKLQVHHIDRNRHNADPGNLEVLCPSCHVQEHLRKRVNWTCPNCGAVREVTPFIASVLKFCSRQCYQTTRTEKGTFGGTARS